MNFNLGDSSHDSEYELFRSTSEELINLYGVPIKYIITKKINQDFIFGEHSHIKIDNNSAFELFAMPGNTDMWDGEDNIFSKFGLQNMDSLTIFLSRTDMERIHPEIVHREGKTTIDNLPNGNLVVFASNKIMEVTDFKLASSDFGNNNVFTSDRDKNVYKISLKSYIANHDDVSEASGITTSENFEYEDFGNLEAIFSDDEDIKEEIEEKSKNIIPADENVYPNPVRVKPVRIKIDEDNPFGDLG